jgi:hypothetical protein
MMVSVPPAVGKYDATTQGQHGKQGNQPGDSTEHFYNPHGYAAMKPKLFSGCNMRLRQLPRIPETRYVPGMQADTNRIHSNASGNCNDSVATLEILDSDRPHGTGDHARPVLAAKRRDDQ